ncbi:MAG: carbamoyltransferase HypF [Anaerolineae bacterium]|nr:carbamoyltransferase HypF [Anaerolineae bacterium]
MTPQHRSTAATDTARRHIHVDGVVQGVGFRPFVYGLAARFDLTGWVLNSSAGVDIEVQGPPADLDTFQAAISAEAPRLARIDRVAAQPVPLDGTDTVFSIRHSASSAGSSLVSPDVATCPDCLAEIFDPANRRYRYPFTNCTNCGPRYTIIRSMPYDRPATTMGIFEMCPDCLAEYENPLDRRFHAQPNACPVCGPRVELVGTYLPTGPDDDIAKAAVLLHDGAILAVKGLGGFHLVCDATDRAAVARLRERKHRPDKPFAVMMSSLEQVWEYCHLVDEEAALLTSVSAPVVLLYQKAGSGIAPNVAPDNPMLGVMLPYTPLHHLLLHDAGVPLVMTSGNLSGLPIITGNGESQEKLGDIADAFLLHDRPIHMRCDDAVWWVDRFAGEQDAARQPLRRSRGDAPYPVRLPWQAGQPILATGAEMKNTLCLLSGHDAILSQHIGEVDSIEALNYYRQVLDHLSSIFKIAPEIVVHDQHPGYLTTRLAHELAEVHQLERIAVQHHHAHIAACLGEHGHKGPVIGVAFDGTGYGPDGTIWGGEILIASVDDYERFAHLEYLPLPGGEAAIRRPYRIAWGYLFTLTGTIPDIPALAGFPAQEKQIVAQQVERGINAPLTSSCGRLFDTVSALTGICPTTTFEAQAAIALELAARESDLSRIAPYPFEIDEEEVIRVGGMLNSIVEDARSGRRVSDISAAFHHTLAAISVETARLARAKTGLDTAALSGGVFQNRLLLRLTRDALRAAGFTVLTHRQVPANDGGLSLGQAVIGLHRTT